MNRFCNLLLPTAAAALLGAGITLAEAAGTRYQQTNLVESRWPKRRAPAINKPTWFRTGRYRRHT